MQLIIIIETLGLQEIQNSFTVILCSSIIKI